MAQVATLSAFDLTRWKPITNEQYVDELGSCFLTMDEPQSVITEFELLPDGRYRLTTKASVLEKDADGAPEVRLEPYLSLLFSPESAHKNLCFIRTDVELAYP